MHCKKFYLDAGKSGIIYAIGDDKVWKHNSEDENRIEQQAYERLGFHPNIARAFGTTCEGGIILERGECLRSVLMRERDIGIDRKMIYVKQAGSGLRHVHKNNIVHADVGCQNLILKDNCVKFIDFEGCSIDSSEATSCYEWFSYRRSTKVSIQTDIFAYGCLVYEIMTGTHPHHELAGCEDRAHRVAQQYQEAGSRT